MRRELRSVGTGRVLGAVDDSRHGASAFIDAAGEVLGGMRRRLGDEEAVRQVIADGWSNGPLYFAEPTP